MPAAIVRSPNFLAPAANSNQRRNRCQQAFAAKKTFYNSIFSLSPCRAHGRVAGQFGIAFERARPKTHVMGGSGAASRQSGDLTSSIR
jgi:hypothetical protein